MSGTRSNAVANGVLARAISWILTRPDITSDRIRRMGGDYHCHWWFSLESLATPERAPIVRAALAQAIRQEVSEIRLKPQKWVFVALGRPMFQLAKQVSESIGEARNGFLVPVVKYGKGESLLKEHRVILFTDVINTGHTVSLAARRLRTEFGCDIRKVVAIVASTELTDLGSIPSIALYRALLDRCVDLRCQVAPPIKDPAEQPIPVPPDAEWSATSFYRASRRTQDLVKVVAAAAADETRCGKLTREGVVPRSVGAPSVGSWLPRHSAIRKVHYEHFLSTSPLLYYSKSKERIRLALRQALEDLNLATPSKVISPYLLGPNSRCRELEQNARAFADLVAEAIRERGGSPIAVSHPTTRKKSTAPLRTSTGERVLVVMPAISKGDVLTATLAELRKHSAPLVDVLVLLNRLNVQRERELSREVNALGGQFASLYELRLPVLFEGLSSCERCAFRKRVRLLIKDPSLPPHLRAYTRYLKNQSAVAPRKVKLYQGTVVGLDELERVAAINPRLVQVVSEEAYWTAQAQGRRFFLSELSRASGDWKGRRSALISNIVRGLPKQALSDPGIHEQLMNYLRKGGSSAGFRRWEDIGRTLLEHGITRWVSDLCEWILSLQTPLVDDPGTSRVRTLTGRLKKRRSFERIWSFVALCIHEYLSAGESEARRIEILGALGRARRASVPNADLLEEVFDQVNRFLQEDDFGDAGDEWGHAGEFFQGEDNDEDGIAGGPSFLFR